MRIKLLAVSLGESCPAHGFDGDFLRRKISSILIIVLALYRFANDYGIYNLGPHDITKGNPL